jgi:hypothetical protein
MLVFSRLSTPTRRSVSDGPGLVTTQRVCLARRDQENFCAPTRRGIPALQVGACHNALLSPGPPVRADRDDLSRKMRAFDGEVAIAVGLTLFSPRVSAFHPGRVHRAVLPDNDHENSRAAINGSTFYGVDLRWQQWCVRYRKGA